MNIFYVGLIIKNISNEEGYILKKLIFELRKFLFLFQIAKNICAAAKNLLSQDILFFCVMVRTKRFSLRKLFFTFSFKKRKSILILLYISLY